MKSFKTVPNNSHKVRFPWEVANAEYFTNFLENGGLVDLSGFSPIRKASLLPTLVVVSSNINQDKQAYSLENGITDIKNQKNTDNIIPFFLTNLLDNNIENRPIFTGNKGLKKSTFLNENNNELEQYQPIHALVSNSHFEKNKIESSQFK